MNDTTYNRRVQQLLQQIMHHPHKRELEELMHAQLADDTFVLATEG